MYIKRIKVANSSIDGKGVFANESISKGEIVWIFSKGHDFAITDQEFQNLPQTKKDHLQHTAYLSPWTKLWVFPPSDDPAEYTNHSTSNNLSVIFDKSVSSEPYFIANRDIKVGEELTNNYHEFDEATRSANPDWAK